ncbi:odorant receptor 145 isoform X1 [Nasonia vitripennis]|uniref:Odorant receptor n=1 Tax=Nasonia vitripennis TaxID=7425 RepID=A0A7M6W8I6_NASVI|nr:odorant receptor 145 [Nasonia vitripennis]XP_031778374.1 odorant receptor 145 isoform X1 [Nasonia vitripennis]
MDKLKQSTVDIDTINNIFGNTYFKINKELQELVGLWPYQKGFSVRVVQTIMLFVLSFIMIPHLNGIRVWCGKDLGICSENIAATIYLSGCFLKYLVVLLCKRDISKVYEKIAINWLTINDPNERVILDKFSSLGKLKSIGYTVYVSAAGIGFSQFALLPFAFDYFSPLQNGSRPKIRIVRAEFFVDPIEYYWHIYATYCIVTFVSAFTIISIDTSYTAVVHQNLGIFNIVKYRLSLAKKAVGTSKDLAYEQIISAVRLHQDSLGFNNLIEVTYRVCFLLLILVCISFLTFGAITILENSDNWIDIVRLGSIEVGAVIHLFYLSWPGQLVVSESEELYYYTYNNEWYNLSAESKTLLHFMMLRCINPCCLTAAGLYVMNFENYGAIIKSTVSYITVLSSFRE